MKKTLAACLRPPLRAVWLRMAVIRCIFGATAALLMRRVAMSGQSLQGLSFLLVAAVFALGAWLAWLRLNGAQLPSFPRTPPRRNRDPLKNMADHLDTPILQPDGLEPGELSACSLMANGACAVLMLVAAIGLAL